MAMSFEWTGNTTPADLATRLAGIPAVVDAALGDRGDVIGAEIVESAKRKVPVDTGRLRASIDYETGPSGQGVVTVFVGSSVEYALFVEFGTRYMGAQPYLRPAIREQAPTLEKELTAALREAFRDV